MQVINNKLTVILDQIPAEPSHKIQRIQLPKKSLEGKEEVQSLLSAMVMKYIIKYLPYGTTAQDSSK